MRAFVLGEDPRPLNVRSGPGTSFDRSAQLPTFSEFTVIEGPECSGGFAWYRIEFAGGRTGWIAEGDATTYFVAPLQPGEEVPADAGGRVLALQCDLILEDEFNDGFSPYDWFQDEGNISIERIGDGAYELNLLRDENLSSSSSDPTSWGSLRGWVFQDARIEAVLSATRWDETPATRMGLWLRYQDDQNFIAFMIRSTGEYRIARFQGGYIDLMEWTESDLIRIGDHAINTLRVDISGNDFTLYINGEFVVTVRDSTWEQGRIVFFGSSPEVPTTFYMDYIRDCEK